MPSLPSLEQLVSDVQANCEITNARFFANKTGIMSEINLKELYRHEKKDMRAYQELPNPILKQRKEFYKGEAFWDFVKRKKELWRNLERAAYKKIPFKPFYTDAGKNLVYNEWKEQAGISYILGHYEERKQLNGNKDCDVILIDNVFATDVHFCITRAFYYSNKWGNRILINKPHAEYEMWSDIKTADNPPSEFVFKEILDHVKTERFEKIMKSKIYKKRFGQKLVLTKCHEGGHWQAREKYNGFKTNSEEQKLANEILADTIPGKYDSTLNYVLNHDDPSHPTLFNMYFVCAQGHEFKFLPELNDVWTSYPYKISRKKLERAIEIGHKRAKRKLKL